jgi:hypothetical protein
VARAIGRQEQWRTWPIAVLRNAGRSPVAQLRSSSTAFSGFVQR